MKEPVGNADPSGAVSRTGWAELSGYKVPESDSALWVLRNCGVEDPVGCWHQVVPLATSSIAKLLGWTGKLPRCQYLMQKEFNSRLLTRLL